LAASKSRSKGTFFEGALNRNEARLGGLENEGSRENAARRKLPPPEKEGTAIKTRRRYGRHCSYIISIPTSIDESKEAGDVKRRRLRRSPEKNLEKRGK